MEPPTPSCATVERSNSSKTGGILEQGAVRGVLEVGSSQCGSGKGSLGSQWRLVSLQQYVEYCHAGSKLPPVPSIRAGSRAPLVDQAQGRVVCGKGQWPQYPLRTSSLLPL